MLSDYDAGFKHQQKNKLHIKLPAFSLIELSLVIIIVGIMFIGIFKGASMVEDSRIQSTIKLCNHYQYVIQDYRSRYNQWPGNDAHAAGRFKISTTNGDGKGLVLASEQKLVWEHLHRAEYTNTSTHPETKLGGYFSVISNPTNDLKGNYLIISNETGKITSLLTPKQASALKAKAGENNPKEGEFIIIPGTGESADACIKDNKYNLANDKASCIVAILLH